MSLTRARTLQYIGILLALGLLAVGYYYFSVRASTLNKSPTSSLTSGLVGYWTFDGADISGTTATDRGSGGGNGTLTGSPAPTRVLAKMGQGLSFDGANSYVEAADSVSLSMAGSLTLSIWFKANALPGAGSDAGLVQKNQGNCSYGLNLTTDNGPKQAYILVSKNNTCTPGANMAQRYTNTAFVTGQWYHLVGVLDTSAQTLNLYVNGVLDNGTLNGTVPTSVFNNIDVLRIGRAWSADYFNGTLDEVRIYNRALSSTEIESLYRLGESDKVNSAISQPQGTGRLESGLAGYWPLDENTGTTAGDTSTNANNGTLTNGPAWTTGKIGSAVDFDGTNDYITVADPASGVLDFTDGTNFSLTGWFNRDTFTSDHTILAKSNGQTASDTGYTVYIDDATDKLTFVANDGTDQYKLESVSTFTATGWHHFALTWDDTSSTLTQLAIDGRAEPATATGTFGNVNSLANALAFRVGAESDGGSPFDGKLDEIRVYHRALSADEVSRLYQTTSPTNPETSLKGYWSFDGPTISGTSVHDLSGAGNTGTLTNGPTPAPGKIGQGMSFDGNNDNVEISSSSSIDNKHTFTYSVWVKPDNSLIGGYPTYSPIIEKGSGSTVIKTLRINQSASGNCDIEADVSTSATHANSGTGALIERGVWQHIVMTYDNAGDRKIRLYRNGSEISYGAQTAGTGTISSDATYNFGFGATPGTQFAAFSGQLDEVRVYNRVLSASEITALYNQGR